jgi:hypothetical protein
MHTLYISIILFHINFENKNPHISVKRIHCYLVYLDKLENSSVRSFEKFLDTYLHFYLNLFDK